MLELCFVCLGNICRSPTGEGVMLNLLEERGLSDLVKVDSAGTAAYHVGSKPDSRSAAAALKRGIKLPSRGRQFVEADFERFDYVLAMDSSNYQSLSKLAGGRYKDKLYLLLDFNPDCPKGSSVPDPYYGGEQGFEEVLDLCSEACEHLLEHIIENHDLWTEDSSRAS